MIVTFVSQCEKKALPRTRRVLDAFANRIGSRTWQTVITADGLLAVKKLLRKTASKSTAVSCHWTRSRSRSELVWIVGNLRKFNAEGIVPVNLTDADIEQFQDSTRWKTQRLIQYAAAIAGLFHDFGKANTLFQDKINPNVTTAVFEPYRHEWLSLRLFQAFVGDKSDSAWLEFLADVQPEAIAPCFKDGIDGVVTEANHPLLKLPPFASLVAWIIVSHHRLPLVPNWHDNQNHNADLQYVDQWLERNFCAIWNSYRCEDSDQQQRLKQNWVFAEKALPYHSSRWRARACDLAAQAKEQLHLWLDKEGEDYINDHLFSSHMARLAVMLADHYYSAGPINAQWRNPNYTVFANSDRKTKALKQQLDEHNIGVAHHAKCIVQQLPKLKQSLTVLAENSFLSDAVPPKFKQAFGWQDRAVKAVGKIAKDTLSQGFFGVNMASTGKGKTIGNAKLMFALGDPTGGARFSVAMGLRTLTLQTAREFRDSLQLTDEQLAVMIGGVAVRQLFENAQTQRDIESAIESSGSESDQQVFHQQLFVNYSGATDEHSLSQWMKGDDRLGQILCAPVLVSTIDHLMPATEGSRGGKQIGPTLRLLTSDLVLDEPDDFGLEDLPALCRLVHWAGLMGSRVLLSTATMPPALANALFQAYQAGRLQFAKANIDGGEAGICCAWFDENIAPTITTVDDPDSYKQQHRKFVASRLKGLAQQASVKRIGEIVAVENNDVSDPIAAIAETLHSHIGRLHRDHHVSDAGQSVSIGLIRMANIDPLVAVAKKLLSLPAPKNTCIHYCVYHSRYPLAIRSRIERSLDNILKRRDPQALWQHEEITVPLKSAAGIENHIFIVLASPVAEVGRDHDYDWAIVEPSSIRSIVQLAGRIQRHREPAPAIATSNVLLLDQNCKALRGQAICFNRPGFESEKLRMRSHQLSEVLPKDIYQKIDASPRIEWPKGCEGRNLQARSDGLSKLNDLEHRALQIRLLNETHSADVWWRQQPHWCGEVQRQQPFRKSAKDEAYYLHVNDEHSRPTWQWLNENVHPPKLGELTEISIKPAPPLLFGENSGFWFEQDALPVYAQLANEFATDLAEVSRRFGELRISNYQTNQPTEYYYSDSLGVFQEMQNR